MRIAHIFDHSVPAHSGYAFRSIAILREQRAHGWTTAQLTSPKQPRSNGQTEAVDGYVFTRTPPIPAPLGRIPVVRETAGVAATARRLAALVRAEGPDLLHAHSPVLNALAALWVGRRFGIPVVYEVRGLWEDAAVDHGTIREGGVRYRAQRGLETVALRRCDAITTICDGLRRDLVARGLPEENITIIPNAVDVSDFPFGGSPDPDLARRLGLAGKTVVGFIGSFYAYEGLDLLLHALARLVRERDDIVLLLVGGGPAEPGLRAIVRALGLEAAVRFVGRVPHAEVVRYYDLVEILVYPRHASRLTEVVTPLKPLEAMARGRIVVASDVGGHRELIRPGATGYLFAADDADALAAALRDVIARRAEWAQVRQAARRFVEEERTWSKSVSRYGSVYRAALSPGRRRGARQP